MHHVRNNLTEMSSEKKNSPIYCLEREWHGMEEKIRYLCIQKESLPKGIQDKTY